MKSEKGAMDVMRLVLRVYSINTNRLQNLKLIHVFKADYPQMN